MSALDNVAQFLKLHWIGTRCYTVARGLIDILGCSIPADSPAAYRLQALETLVQRQYQVSVHLTTRSSSAHACGRPAEALEGRDKTVDDGTHLCASEVTCMMLAQISGATKLMATGS